MSESELQGKYVGFWYRVEATLIDLLWMTPITMLLAWSVYGERFWAIDEQPTSGSWEIYFQHLFTRLGPADVLISDLLPAVMLIALCVRFSRTPGKKVIGAIIVDARTGGKPTLRQFIIRYLGSLISSYLLLGVVWVAFDRRKQSWHDKMAGTVVIWSEPRKQLV